MAGIGDIAQAHKIREQLLNRQSGKWLLHQSNPNEFEYYMVAFELLKSDLSTSKYFVFPILPNSIEYNDSVLTKISQTAGGVSVLKTTKFNIKTINLTGTFGRGFKVLIGDTYQNLISNFKEDNSNTKEKSIIGGVLDSFSSSIKTGYGCCKILEDMLDSSNQKDEFGGAQYLIFYNLAFNQKFFVEFEDKTFSQSLESNMVWNYSLRLKATGPVDNYLNAKMENKKSNLQLTIDNILQQSANTVYSKVSKILNKTYDQAISSIF